ncbi:MAG: hypothetical protein IKM59_03585 [Oscillospiraceae bacterium]|nr:hypothetical protein [Oscillospiraceae bacterium]
MLKHCKRIIYFLFCILLCAQCFALATPAGLEKVVKDFLFENGLDASNFAMSYYNPVSGETYDFNAEAFLPVGKLRFLPMQMYFYEEESKGTFEPQTPEEPEFTIAGMTLEECRYHSIILSEEQTSEKMITQIGTPGQYLELMNQRYGMIEPDTLPLEYQNGQVLSTRYLMNCIRIISSRPELFPGLMSNYAMTQKADAFANGAVSYSVVQIRGEADGYITAVAEVSAPQNFLLVASVKTASGGDEVLGKLNKVICNYILNEMGQEVKDETQPTTRKNSSNYYIGEERMAKDNTPTRWLITTFAIAGTVALIGLVIWLVWRSRNRKY